MAELILEPRSLDFVGQNFFLIPRPQVCPKFLYEASEVLSSPPHSLVHRSERGGDVCALSLLEPEEEKASQHGESIWKI